MSNNTASAVKTPKEKRIKDYTSGPLFGRIILFALPVMATNVLQTLYNTADMVIVGRYASSHAMGGVGASANLLTLLLNFFIGISVGAGVTVAQAIGAKDYGSVKKLVHSSFLASIVCGVGIGMIGIILAEPLLVLMGTPEENLAEAIAYTRAYLVGAPASIVFNFLAAAIRSSGDTKTPFVVLSVSGIVNVLANLVFVIVFGFGAVGVGIATTIAQYISAVWLMIHMFRMENCCKLSWADMRVDFGKLGQICKIGVPSGIQSSLFSVSNVIIQSSINSFGAAVVEANSAAGSIESFVGVIMTSFYYAAITIIGQNFGARKYRRIVKASLMCGALSFTSGMVLGRLVYIFGEPLISIYAPATAEGSAAIIEAGLIRMSYIACFYGICGLMDITSGILRAMGKTVLPMFSSLFANCGIRLIWIFTVCKMYPSDLGLLYVIYPISWALALVFQAAMCVWIIRGLIKKQKAEASELCTE